MATADLERASGLWARAAETAFLLDDYIRHTRVLTDLSQLCLRDSKKEIGTQSEISIDGFERLMNVIKSNFIDQLPEEITKER
jgi:hypothetical protein